MKVFKKIQINDTNFPYPDFYVSLYIILSFVLYLIFIYYAYFLVAINKLNESLR